MTMKLLIVRNNFHEIYFAKINFYCKLCHENKSISANAALLIKKLQLWNLIANISSQIRKIIDHRVRLGINYLQ